MRGSDLGCFTKPKAGSSYTPRTVLVLPTSTTSNIRCPPSQRTDAAGNHDAQSLIGAHTKKTPGIKTVRSSTIAAIFIHVHELAVSVRGAGLDLFENLAELDCRDLDRIVHSPQ